MNERIEEQPYDDRHNTAVDKEAVQRVQTPAFLLDSGDHLGNDHQAANPGSEEFRMYPTPPQMPESAGPSDDGTGFFRPVERFRAPEEMPRRDSFIPDRMPSFGSGLNWVASAQSPIRGDLVNYEWGTMPGFVNHVTNIELRTIYAHLLETAGQVRAEMRERGMQVDL